ncbi:FISUMP domain-containing protein [Bacteroides eggerthii]|uniref:FISUMP domain-containing protein n=1 Tax=Bacteroides eggerthii TaxID=28111 RepID=UPI00189E8007|nr:FISUMP domain-containing protein [Bacteroides eggerthii]
MKQLMIKYMLLYLSVGGILAACAEQELPEEEVWRQTGAVALELTLPAAARQAGGEVAESAGSAKLYPEDVEIRRLDVHVFGRDGVYLKSYPDVENRFTGKNATATVELQDVPAGGRRTFLCVANSGCFPELASLRGKTLEEVAAMAGVHTNGDAGAPMFMVSKIAGTVKASGTTAFKGVLLRGVARLDIVSADAGVQIDSVIIENAVAVSRLFPQGAPEDRKQAVKKELRDFNGNSRVAYLNESVEPLTVSVVFVHEGRPLRRQAVLSGIARNSVYALNVNSSESGPVIGEITQMEWTENVIEGEVESDITLDKEATVASFRVEGGEAVTVENDTVLVLPGGRSVGMLYFKDDAEVAVSLMNPEDAAVVSINKNAVTRGFIKTGYDIEIREKPTADPNDVRDVKLWVGNLMTGTGRVFVVRQKGPGYVSLDVPALTFENNHYYEISVPLPGINDVYELNVPADTAFEVIVAKQDGMADYTLKVKRKRIYDVVPLGRKLTVTKNGRKAVVLNLTPDAGFAYKEVNLGDITFMDRDLGAASGSVAGELFIPGSLMPLDQRGFANGELNGYTGQGRVDPDKVHMDVSTNWFTNTDGTKNELIDPCPKGWHTASYDDFSKIFTMAVAGQSSNVFTGQGALRTTVTINNREKNVSVALNGNRLDFPWSNSGQWDGSFNQLPYFPIAWWSSTKNDRNLYHHLSFQVVQPYKVAWRIHNQTVNTKRGYNIRCVKDGARNPVAAPAIPSVVLGGKRWMAFNSMGAGDSTQYVTGRWESIEEIYRKNWTEHLGMLFQWGRKYPHNQWDSYTNNPGAQTNLHERWNDAANAVPCPDGYRVPTYEEVKALLPENLDLPSAATYEYGGERIRATLHYAEPANAVLHQYSGEARYLKLTSVATGGYLIFPLAGGKNDKASASDPKLGHGFQLWTDNRHTSSTGRAVGVSYWPGSRNMARPGVEGGRPKEAYSYVRCIRK